MTPRNLRNIHATGNSCRDALPCGKMALKLPPYFYLLMEKPFGCYFFRRKKAVTAFRYIFIRNRSVICKKTSALNPSFLASCTKMEHIMDIFLEILENFQCRISSNIWYSLTFAISTMVLHILSIFCFLFYLCYFLVLWPGKNLIRILFSVKDYRQTSRIILSEFKRIK